MTRRRRSDFTQAIINDNRHVVPTLGDPRYSQSLERGLAILSSFSPEHPLVKVSEIATALGMQKSTTHRYLATLVKLGYLEQGPARQYKLGLRVVDLGMSSLNAASMHEHAQPLLEELRRRTSYTVSLAVLDGPDVIYVARAFSSRRGRYTCGLDLQPDSRLPAYCTATGKLLLAYLPEEARECALNETTFTQRAPHTITTRRVLAKELEGVVDSGFAINDQELAQELHAIAVPVRSDTREVVAAASMVAHVSMIGLDELVDALLPHLVTTADRISSRLGYRRDDEIAASAGAAA